MKETSKTLFSNAYLTPQPKGTIQFSSPVKTRQLTPKSSQFIHPLHSDNDVPIRARGVSFNLPMSMTQSSIFFTNEQNQPDKQMNITKKLEFKSKDKPSSHHNKNNNDLSKYTSSLLSMAETPILIERKVSNPYSIKIISDTDIPHQQQKMSFNPQLKRPMAKQKLQFSPLRLKHKHHHHRHAISDFHLGNKLGKGNFGDVFLAQHKDLGFIFALKIVPKKIVIQKKMERQLLWQAHIQMTLNHPNIVSLYGMFHDQNNIYFVQQLVTEGHLFVQMKHIRKFSEEETASIMKQLCDAVEYMHRNSIIHRDLKPENILIQFGVHKICDFGWAVYAPDTMRTTYCGTPLYMSPELIKGQRYTEAVDNWALGILTYELLIGRSPFKINSTQELNKIITQQVQFPQYVALSEEAKSFILKLLNKDPDERTELDVMLQHPFLKQAKRNEPLSDFHI